MSPDGWKLLAKISTSLVVVLGVVIYYLVMYEILAGMPDLSYQPEEWTFEEANDFLQEVVIQTRIKDGVWNPIVSCTNVFQFLSLFDTFDDINQLLKSTSIEKRNESYYYSCKRQVKLATRMKNQEFEYLNDSLNIILQYYDYELLTFLDADQIPKGLVEVGTVIDVESLYDQSTIGKWIEDAINYVIYVYEMLGMFYTNDNVNLNRSDFCFQHVYDWNYFFDHSTFLRGLFFLSLLILFFSFFSFLFLSFFA